MRDGALVRAALNRIPFLVTAELFMTASAIESPGASRSSELLESAATTLPSNASPLSLAPTAGTPARLAARSDGNAELTVHAVPRLFAGGGTAAHDRASSPAYPKRR